MSSALRKEHGDAQELVRVRMWDTVKLAELADWLVSMDDPEDVIGREERRVVTLTKIIDRAKDAQA